jgi:hypothetical protein
MKNKLILPSLFLATAILAHAVPILTIGTPGNSLLSKPTGPSPIVGTLFNFDGLTPNTTFTANTFAAQGVSSISSPDGLFVLPDSTQSGPNELFDTSLDGSANIAILLAGGVEAIGIGIADSDPVSITLQALGSTGTGLGTTFTINLTIPANFKDPNNPGNLYLVLSDTTADIFGLKLLQTTGSVNNSGLAIDDLQVAPEPASFLLLAAGISVLAFLHWRRQA